MASLVGAAGTMTIASLGEEGPGQVEVKTPGGSCTYIAYSDEPIDRHTQVMVINERPGHKLDVTKL